MQGMNNTFSHVTVLWCLICEWTNWLEMQNVLYACLLTHMRSFGSYSKCVFMNLLRTELNCEKF